MAAIGMVTALLAERLGRHIFPLASLLQMSRLVPDRAPSRTPLALRSISLLTSSALAADPNRPSTPTVRSIDRRRRRHDGPSSRLLNRARTSPSPTGVQPLPHSRSELHLRISVACSSLTRGEVRVGTDRRPEGWGRLGWRRPPVTRLAATVAELLIPDESRFPPGRGQGAHVLTMVHARPLAGRSRRVRGIRGQAGNRSGQTPEPTVGLAWPVADLRSDLDRRPGSAPILTSTASAFSSPEAPIGRSRRDPGHPCQVRTRTSERRVHQWRSAPGSTRR